MSVCTKIATWKLSTSLCLVAVVASCDVGMGQGAPPVASDEPAESSSDEGSASEGFEGEDCKEDVCDGGFVLNIRPSKGVYPVAEYQLDIEVEGFEHVATCRVVEGGDGECEWSGESSFFLQVGLDDDVDGTDGHVFRVEAREYTEPGITLRGPESVSIELSRFEDGSSTPESLGSEAFEPDYLRKEPWGAPQCGFCDVLDVPLTMTVNLP